MGFIQKIKALLSVATILISSGFAHADVINSASIPEIAFDGSGNFVAVWGAMDQTTGLNVIQASSYSVLSGEWSVPTTISALDQNSNTPLVAMNSSGNAIAIWTADDGTTNWLAGSTLPLGGDWSSIFHVSSGTQIVLSSPEDYRMQIDNSNNIFVVWTAYDTIAADTYIFGSRAVFGGGWTTVNISSP